MTTHNPDNILKDIIHTAIFRGGDPIKPVPESEYRFYHCLHILHELKCVKVNRPEILPSQNNTHLLVVKKYIPERFDNIILKYQSIPTKVIIEEKST